MPNRKSHASAYLLLLAASFTQGAAVAQHPYLDDSNPPAMTDSSLMRHEYPRVYMYEWSSGINAEGMSKYHFMVAHGQHLDKLEDAQAWSPETMVLRQFSGRAYQGFNFKDCHISAGIAFEATTATSQGGPSTDGCGIFAGHWIYRPGSPLRSSIGESARTLPVEDASRFEVGQYVVIYDAPAGSFKNAEHVKVTGRSLSNNTLSTAPRGFKSTPSSHAAGAIVAQHVTGQGPEAELWAWNMTTQSPRDAANRTFAEFYSAWLAKNLRKYRTGITSSADVAGILFDADLYIELSTNSVDANNDLVEDNGWSPTGVNWLGEGLDDFYALVSARLPGKYLLTGVYKGRGFESTNGTELESWLDFGNGDFEPHPTYNYLNSMFSAYLYNMGSNNPGVKLVQGLSKTPTLLYPMGTNAPNNRPARLGLAMTLMEDGYYGTHSSVAPDAWYDEYAVDVDPASPTYGKAINMYSYTAIHDKRGWLGQPLEQFSRIYDATAFSSSRSIVANGSFDSSISQWTGKNVNLSRITSAFEGAGALRVPPMNNYNSSPSGAQVRSSQISLESGKEYTVAFAARAATSRQIKVNLGSSSKEEFMIGPEWRRYIMSFEQTANEDRPLIFSVGRESVRIDIDSVYVFEGNVNVFKREFENGIVVANATARPRSISLGGTYQRIDGQQDPSVNNGQTVTSVILPPFDGLLLVRPIDGSSDGGSSSGGSSSGGSSGGGSGGQGLVGDLVWTDSNGDGVQDSSESGRGGVTVQLLSCDTGNTVDSLTTDSSGAFNFNVSAGNYRLKFVAPSGTRLSPSRSGSDGSRDSNPDPSTGLTSCFSMTDTQTRGGIDAGLIVTSSGGSAMFGDLVWNDSDRDGIQDGNESGLAGAVVELQTCEGSVIESLTTGSSGAYSFAVNPGSYRMRFIPPNGMQLSPSRRGSARDVDSNPDPSTGLSGCMSMSEGQQRSWIDAGMY